MTDPHAFRLISLVDLLILCCSLYVAWVLGKCWRKFLTSRWRLIVWYRHPEELPVGTEVGIGGLAYRVTRHLWRGFVVIGFTGYASRGETDGYSNRG